MSRIYSVNEIIVLIHQVKYVPVGTSYGEGSVPRPRMLLPALAHPQQPYLMNRQICPDINLTIRETLFTNLISTTYFQTYSCYAYAAVSQRYSLSSRKPKLIEVHRKEKVSCNSSCTKHE